MPYKKVSLPISQSLLIELVCEWRLELQNCERHRLVLNTQCIVFFSDQLQPIQMDFFIILLFVEW